MMIGSDKSNRLAATNENPPAPFGDEDRMNLVGLVVASGEQADCDAWHSLFDIGGNLANGALIEFWQANLARRDRSPPHAIDLRHASRLVGSARCRKPDGSSVSRTIEAGASVSQGLRRAPNVTMITFPHGFSRRDPSGYRRGKARLSFRHRGRLKKTEDLQKLMWRKL
jgi:hypothetical protein